jgi:hypothetical protein
VNARRQAAAVEGESAPRRSTGAKIGVLTRGVPLAVPTRAAQCRTAQPRVASVERRPRREMRHLIGAPLTSWSGESAPPGRRPCRRTPRGSTPASGTDSAPIESIGLKETQERPRSCQTSVRGTAPVLPARALSPPARATRAGLLHTSPTRRPWYFRSHIIRNLTTALLKRCRRPREPASAATTGYRESCAVVEVASGSGTHTWSRRSTASGARLRAIGRAAEGWSRTRSPSG